MKYCFDCLDRTFACCSFLEKGLAIWGAWAIFAIGSPLPPVKDEQLEAASVASPPLVFVTPREWDWSTSHRSVLPAATSLYR